MYELDNSIIRICINVYVWMNMNLFEHENTRSTILTLDITIVMTIVVHLKLTSRKSRLITCYVIVGHIYNFGSWGNRYKNLVLIGKNKMRKCRIFVFMKMLKGSTRKFPFHCFSFSGISCYTFEIFFHAKSVHMYSIKPFHTYHTK